MIKFILVLIALGYVSAWDMASDGNSSNSQQILSRRKRYIVFPKGSSLQLVIELLPEVPDAPNEVVVGPTIGVAWELPTDSKHFLEKKSHHREKRRTKMRLDRMGTLLNFEGIFTLIFKYGTTAGVAWMLPDDPNLFLSKKKHKIFKRSVYQKTESYMNALNMNGRQCILRALCESGQRTPSKKPFFHEILHKIFSLESEEMEDEEYRKAHGSVNSNCTKLYPDCPFSLFNLPFESAPLSTL